MDALDTAIRLASSDRVSPTAAGTVRAFAGRYGKRGDLKTFIISELKSAAPGAVTTSTVVLGPLATSGFNSP